VVTLYIWIFPTIEANKNANIKILTIAIINVVK
jgi:hypothetical protein